MKVFTARRSIWRLGVLAIVSLGIMSCTTTLPAGGQRWVVIVGPKPCQLVGPNGQDASKLVVKVGDNIRWQSSDAQPLHLVMHLAATCPQPPFAFPRTTTAYKLPIPNSNQYFISGQSPTNILSGSIRDGCACDLSHHSDDECQKVDPLKPQPWQIKTDQILGSQDICDGWIIIER